LILLAMRGQESELPGNRAAMQKYEAAIRTGRRVKYAAFPVEFRFQHVPAELRADVEEALQGVEHGQTDQS
jgi:hypothetical protein